MSVKEEVEKIMSQAKTRKRIGRMARKNDVSYDIAKAMFVSTLESVLNEKEIWSQFEVRIS
jgi:hypothetical protein